ncbi:MAG: amidase [Alphaproteobacteria bacterium]|nr:amidase [Alphaproteobacteria bacterium]
MTDLREAGPGGLNLLSAIEARAKLDRGEITSQALVRDCLTRIAAREPDLDAWAFVDPDLALEQARARDNEISRGLLHGIPVGIKDIYDTADMPTEYGTTIYPGHRPSADSTWVAALRDAGAVILGKTRTTEFANPVPTTTRNPHDLDCAPGASSSGSVAAVADYMTPLATGSQTGGSVILPAAHCGLYGYKPSFDGLPTGGVRHAKPSIDTPGLFARTLDDVALMRAASLGQSPAALDLPAGAGLRVGVCRTEYWPEALPESVSTLASAAEILAAAGATVSDIEPPAEVSQAMAEFSNILVTEDSRAIAMEARDHLDQLNEWSQKSVREAKDVSPAQYENANAVAEVARAAMTKTMEDFDVLITPATRGEAPRDRANMEPSLFNRIWTLMYLPCLSLPAFTGPSGLPVGLQIVGRRDDDERLLAMGRWIEQRIAQATEA